MPRSRPYSGITLASLALGWIGEPALAHLLEPPFALIVGGFASAAPSAWRSP